jgi:hypothetical protein
MAGNVIPEGSFWVRWLAVPWAAVGSGVAAVLRVRAAVKTVASGDLGGPRPGGMTVANVRPGICPDRVPHRGLRKMAVAGSGLR